MQPMPSSDAAYAVDTPAGVVAYFEAVVDEAHRFVSRLTGGDQALTEDILQDSFLALLHQSNNGRIQIAETGWIMTTARHRFIDHVRSRQREARRVERRAFGSLDSEASPEYAAISSEHARWMLAQLPDDERWALALHTVAGMPIKQVARILGRSPSATTSLLARARRRLRALTVEVAK